MSRTDAKGVLTEEGSIEGALFTIQWVPITALTAAARTDRLCHILIYCHGYRPSGIELNATLQLDTGDPYMVGPIASFLSPPLTLTYSRGSNLWTDQGAVKSRLDRK